MIVKVIGMDSFGQCIERQAEMVGLWETEANLRKMMRKKGEEYLVRWPHVAAVDMRRDENHKRIVKVERKKPKSR